MTLGRARRTGPGAAPARQPDGGPAEPTQRVGRRWIALIALANLGLYLAYLGPISVLLPDQVQDIAGPAPKVAVLGLVTGLGAAVAMIANPVAGALSDRTASRFGRRRRSPRPGWPGSGSGSTCRWMRR